MTRMLARRTRTKAPRTGVRVTRAAGWVAVGMGVVHLAVAPLDVDGLWSQVIDEGVWNTFTLEPDRSVLSEVKRSEALWATVASWAAPVLVFGGYVVWSTYQGHRVPEWLGWIVLTWGLLFAILVPVSPAWAFPIIGGLIVLGDRLRRRPVSE